MSSGSAPSGPLGAAPQTLPIPLPQHLLVAAGTAGWSAVFYLRDGQSLYLPLTLVALVIGGAALALNRTWLRGALVRRPRNILLGLGLGVAMAGATYLAAALLGPLWPFLDKVPQLFAQLRAWPGPIAALPLMTIIVLAEELIWRGASLEVPGAGHLSSKSTLRALGLSAALYALAMAGSGMITLVVLALVCGIFWGLLRLWSGDLITPLLCHLVWDAIVMVAYPLDNALPGVF